MQIIQIFIKTLTGNNISIDAISSDTILDIKKKFEEKEGMPIDIITLLFSGKRLEDTKTLEHYNIENNSTLYLCLNMQFRNTTRIE